MKSNFRFNRNKRGIECSNCKQPLSVKDNFCSNCSQVNDLRPLSIKQYLAEFLSGFFSFDSRTINTIFPLLIKPGIISKEYIKGKRMKYVNPFKLYLHTSIIFFLLIGLFSRFDEMNKLLSLKKETKNKNKVYYKKKNDFIISIDDKNTNLEQRKIILTEAKLDSLISQQVDSIFMDKKFKKLILNYKKDKKSNTDKLMMDLYFNYITDFVRKQKEKYKSKNKSLTNLNSLKDRFIKISEKKLKEENINYKFGTFSKMNVNEMALSKVLGEGLFGKISLFQKCKTKDPVKALDSLKIPKTKMNLFLYIKTKKIDRMFDKNGGDLRDNFYDTFTSKISIVLFFILPVFTLFMFLFYIRNNFSYTEHLIFVFHLQTVFFILLIFAEILDRIFNVYLFTIGSWIYFIIYLYIAMKNFYKQNNFKTSIKYFLAVSTYFVLTLTGFVVLTFLLLLL